MTNNYAHVQMIVSEFERIANISGGLARDECTFRVSIKIRTRKSEAKSFPIAHR